MTNYHSKNRVGHLLLVSLLTVKFTYCVTKFSNKWMHEPMNEWLREEICSLLSQVMLESFKFGIEFVSNLYRYFVLLKKHFIVTYL